MEHLRNGILAAVEELGCDVGRGPVDTANSVGNEGFNVVWNLSLVKRICYSSSLSEGGDEVQDDADVCSDFFHCFDVKLEV